MENKFFVKLKEAENHSISVLFYSEHKLNLMVTQIKAFYQPMKCDENNLGFVYMKLDNNSRIKNFNNFPKNTAEYTSLNFIVKDRTSKTQYAVQLPLHGGEPRYTEMLYEST